MSRPISKGWVALSVVIFVALELLIGGFVAEMLKGRAISHMLGFRIELGMSLISFCAGGFLVGVVSPGERLLEPAIGAAISVLFTFLIAFFTPLAFFHTSPTRMIGGGLIAFAVALFGAHVGERVTGN